jgi:hypothetical protein
MGNLSWFSIHELGEVAQRWPGGVRCRCLDNRGARAGGIEEFQIAGRAENQEGRS